MSESVEPDAEVDVVEQQQVRIDKRQEMLDVGVSPYPVVVPVTHTIREIRESYGELDPEEKTGVTAGVSGRIMHLRVTGKLAFIVPVIIFTDGLCVANIKCIPMARAN